MSEGSHSLGRVLAVDYGRRHAGIAISDPDRVIARPMAVIDFPTPERGVSLVAELASAWQVRDVVVGLPRKMDGSEGEMAHEVRAWATRLAEATGIPVHLVDERLTTVEAERIVPSRRGRRKRNDDVAAAILLRVFMDYLR